MAKKRKGPGGGNPANQVKPTVKNPCPKCTIRSRVRDKAGNLGIWCPTCSESARKRGVRNARPGRVSRAVVMGAAAALGIDPDGTVNRPVTPTTTIRP